MMYSSRGKLEQLAKDLETFRVDLRDCSPAKREVQHKMWARWVSWIEGFQKTLDGILQAEPGKRPEPKKEETASK